MVTCVKVTDVVCCSCFDVAQLIIEIKLKDVRNARIILCHPIDVN